MQIKLSVSNPSEDRAAASGDMQAKLVRPDHISIVLLIDRDEVLPQKTPRFL